MRPFTFTWLAGWYEAAPSTVAHDWGTKRRNGGGIAGSELGDPARSRATREDGWTHTPWMGEGKGECVVSLDKTRWRVTESLPLELLRPRKPGMTGRQRAGNYAATVVAEDQGTADELIVSVAHKFAHVEGVWGRRTRAVLTWQHCARRWAKQIKRLRREYPVDVKVLLLMDGNLDVSKPWCRAVIRHQFRRAGTDLRVVAPANGTHGGRVIDFALTNLAGHAHTEPATASDHRAVVFNLKEKP